MNKRTPAAAENNGIVGAFETRRGTPPECHIYLWRPPQYIISPRWHSGDGADNSVHSARWHDSAIITSRQQPQRSGPIDARDAFLHFIRTLNAIVSLLVVVRHNGRRSLHYTPLPPPPQPPPPANNDRTLSSAYTHAGGTIRRYIPWFIDT